MLKHLAVDIGASSGRHIIGMIQNDEIILQEVYRFENKTQPKNGHLVWDANQLFQEILNGLKACKQQDLIPNSMGIDTWAVDYALLDENDKLLGDIMAYRDNRTQGMDTRLEEVLPQSRHYVICGIAKQPFNTIYQLISEDAQHLKKARTFLMVPDYFHFLLTGVKSNEYTNASTTALINAWERTWDKTVLNAAGIDAELFSAPLLNPGAMLGPLKKEVVDEIGFRTEVILPATHDTGSAYLAVPARDDKAVYLSSGTWSLLGVESDVPIMNEAARIAGFTNEGGTEGKVRFLKNIMGMWILQSIRREWEQRYEYADMAQMALKGNNYPGIFDVNNERFLAPASMLKEIYSALNDAGFAAPTNDCELLHSVYNSLVICYRDAIGDLKRITGKVYTSINIVGGGSQNAILNQMIADGTKLPVYAGPKEGTALGNIIAQLIASGDIPSLCKAREMIKTSFGIQTFIPKETI